ncbi:MAG: hypothetical protein IPM37_15675 [Hahellaceae bacterium]|nr:hypothetical protein [Hahellaceae bacterium]
MLKLNLMGYWHAGTGRSAGTRVDALTEKDRHELPFLSGRTLKGLLRDAVVTAAALPWFSSRFGFEPDDGYSLAELIFGTRGDGNQPRDTIHNGILRVGDARLSAVERDWLSSTEAGKALIPGLYREVFSTAIDYESGTARDGSLRGMEVCVPCALVADVEIIPPVGSDGFVLKQNALLERKDQVFTILRDVLPLIDAVGAHRNRGFGRVQLQIEEVR